ncbi:MAG: hypothetical protein BWY88_00405 [Synergistetes bacterium ADurb.Bin520]|nr:MAG: hypothetical protein BWY88_00405 [Synergistetes bacterium ADurb.Bin520]
MKVKDHSGGAPLKPVMKISPISPVEETWLPEQAMTSRSSPMRTTLRVGEWTRSQFTLSRGIFCPSSREYSWIVTGRSDATTSRARSSAEKSMAQSTSPS